MPSVTITVTGSDALLARLRGAGARATDLNGKAVRKVTQDVERDAKLAAPVDTGMLQNSIHGTATGGAVATGRVSPATHYASYVEYGTSRMRPQPYMRPAAERNAPQLVRAVEQIPRLVLG